ncbi:hypothetical protein JOB18_011596 [Solea senegalensis]|uniref:Uncharacterized protein n=1 Tax=Solea senegalensis TaxID=28829 RepID=A0AAV6T5L4_SOLSE|nr:hypothetical protein JOB18_011596 [Solea senegalensis]
MSIEKSSVQLQTGGLDSSVYAVRCVNERFVLITARDITAHVRKTLFPRLAVYGLTTIMAIKGQRDRHEQTSSSREGESERESERGGDGASGSCAILTITAIQGNLLCFCIQRDPRVRLNAEFNNNNNNNNNIKLLHYLANELQQKPEVVATAAAAETHKCFINVMILFCDEVMTVNFQEGGDNSEELKLKMSLKSSENDDKNNGIKKTETSVSAMMMQQSHSSIGEQLRSTVHLHYSRSGQLWLLLKLQKDSERQQLFMQVSSVE